MTIVFSVYNFSKFLFRLHLLHLVSHKKTCLEGDDQEEIFQINVKLNVKCITHCGGFCAKFIS